MNASTSISRYFEKMTDYRYQNVRHPLINILTISLCAIICGADDWVEIEQWGLANEDWLSEILDLSHGIPSHDTLGRVFRHLDADEFNHYFMMWTKQIAQLSEGEVVAIDGKQLRGSKDGVVGQSGIYMVSAWATENSLVLAQEKVPKHTNEITAIPHLLQILDIKGCIVTVDALNCQTNIAKAIIEQGADYILAVRGNQMMLHADLISSFEGEFTRQRCSYHQTINKGHGRIEIRQCWAIEEPGWVQHIQDVKQWAGLRTLVRVDSERRIGEESSLETRYFISTLPADAKTLLAAIRSHWQIENGLHWVLDIAFREDHNRTRKDAAPQNLAVMRHIAINLLKQENSLKIGLKAKRKRAGWDKNYLVKILRQ